MGNSKSLAPTPTATVLVSAPTAPTSPKKPLEELPVAKPVKSTTPERPSVSANKCPSSTHSPSTPPPAAFTHDPYIAAPILSRPSSSSRSRESLSCCNNCKKVAPTVVLLQQLPFCSKECYWSYHVTNGLDDETEGSMVIVQPRRDHQFTDSYVQNRILQRHRRSISAATGASAKHDSQESPRSQVDSTTQRHLSRYSSHGLSTSRESSHNAVTITDHGQLHTNTPDMIVSPRSGMLSSVSPCVEEFDEELDEAQPTEPQQIPPTPTLTRLTPFSIPPIQS